MTALRARRRRVNEHAWDLRTGVHLDSSFYDVPSVRAGRCTLGERELSQAGDVTGARLLHLQCHFGLDTISWARRGALATGVDFSRTAVAEARSLAAELSVPAEFHRADVQDLPAGLRGFDLAVASYGVMCWLDDLSAWAASVHGALRPGGRFLLVEFHPVLELALPGSVSGHGSYFGVADPPPAATSGTYTDRDAPIHYQEYRWQHPVGDVVNALVGAGLELTSLGEHPDSPVPLFDRELEGGPFARAPRTYSITARRKP
ncbi:bifunctional 2-polyprenyl-6-hydroxyphenol methylase/3-demethylubiquinol 3-O-methyltransferase UbiG [uncultured Streptomyces sp.]|uniref:class I SAM-dependent methyltransferase n=1 Tax=uncultured Streptomyces sp. TaxID=174707 RepID=UPI0026202E84|nr:class I SAM-dependent methyltransferase [uncultured Streptomyces sp.]